MSFRSPLLDSADSSCTCFIQSLVLVLLKSETEATTSGELGGVAILMSSGVDAHSMGDTGRPLPIKGLVLRVAVLDVVVEMVMG